MTVSLTHTTQSARPQSSDTGLISSNAWNENHVLTAAGLSVLCRAANSAGSVSDLAAPANSGYALQESGGALVFAALPNANFFSGVSQSITNNKTVTSGESGQLLELASSVTARKTLTYGAASGYNTGHVNILVNSSVRAWPYTLDAVTDMLWPGQTMVVVKGPSGNWLRLFRKLRFEFPDNINMTITIDNVSGHTDTTQYDGLGSDATLKFVQDALNLGLKADLRSGGLNINLPATTATPITENVSIAGPMVGTAFDINIVGNPNNPTACQWFKTGASPLISVADWVTITANGISCDTGGSGGNFIQARQNCIVDMLNIKSNNLAGASLLSISDNSRASTAGAFTVAGNCFSLLTMLNGSGCGVSGTWTFSGSPTISDSLFYGGISSYYSSSQNPTFSGAITSGKKFTLAYGSFLGIGGISWPSGASSGTVDATSASAS